MVDMNAGAIASMKELGVTESYKLKRQVVISASEASEMILVSGTIRLAPDMFAYMESPT
jgi:T-complex protein 1 subunit beta